MQSVRWCFAPPWTGASGVARTARYVLIIGFAMSNDFEKRLRIYNDEVFSTTYSFFTYLYFNQVASTSNSYLIHLNKNPYFWKTVLHSLQLTFIISLGRIFDNAPNAYSVSNLINYCSLNIRIFSKQALRIRKRNGKKEPELLGNDLSNAYEPESPDFRQIKKKLKELRRIYDPGLLNIRNKIFAHKIEVDKVVIENMFSQNQIDTIEKLIDSLNDIYQILWQLYHNGRKPTLGKPNIYYKQEIHNEVENVLQNLIKNT